MKKQFYRISAMLLAAMLVTGTAGCSVVGDHSEQISELFDTAKELAEKKIEEKNEGAAADSVEESESDSENSKSSDPSGLQSSGGDSEVSEAAGGTAEENGDIAKENGDTAGKNAAAAGKNAEITEAEEKTAKTEGSDGAEKEARNKGSEEPAEEKPSVLDSLPEKGEVLHGFRVTDIEELKVKNAKLVVMEHEKSGAEAIYIACDDPDKAVTIGYRTVSQNDKGIPHVFEHITLSGSGKYPSASLWDEIANGTYNTYMNAMTSQQYTEYLMSSLSEDQLLAIMDFYMDGLTDPMALRDEHPLKREAYRFELDSPEGDIRVTGAVFNEMESANSGIFQHVVDTAHKQLYPYSVMSSNTGGSREDIITITLDELKSFYSKYYHPSNMLIMLYGDMDVTRFLEKLDRDYLSKYEKRSVSITDDKYIPWTGYKSVKAEHPAEEDSDPENGTMLYYCVSLGNIGMYDRELMAVTEELISAENSPLKQRMDKDFPDAEFETSIFSELTEPVVYFALIGANEGDGERFRTAVDESIAEICEKGLDRDNTEAIIRKQMLDDILSAEEPGGIGLCEQFICCWAMTGDALSYLDARKAVENLERESKRGMLDELVEKYLRDGNQRVLVEMNPVPGLKEAEDKAFAQLLADKKAGMTDVETAQLVGDTLEFNTWSELSSSSSLLNTVKAVGTAELPEEIQTAEVKDEEQDGIRIISSEIQAAGYLEAEMYLDAQTLDYEEIHDFVFLGELLGSLATENYSVEQLDTEFKKNIYSGSIGADIIYGSDGKPHPYLTAGILTASDSIEEGWELIREILTATDFSDTGRIGMLASSAELNYTYERNMNPESAVIAVGKAAADPNGLYEYHAMELDYRDYLKKVASMNESQLKALAKRLENVLDKLLNKNGMILTFIGSESGIKTGRSQALKLAEEFGTEALPAADYSEQLGRLGLPKRIAVTVEDNVNFNGLMISNSDAGIEKNGKNKVMLNAIHNTILYPEFRYNIGAYGIMSGVGDRSSYVISYRDPGIAASFESLESLGQKVREAEIGQEDVESAVMSAYSSWAYPLSARSLAETEIGYLLSGKTSSYSEECLKNMKEAKKVTADDVEKAAEDIDDIIENSVRITAGSTASIRENRDLYDKVITDLTR